MDNIKEKVLDKLKNGLGMMLLFDLVALLFLVATNQKPVICLVVFYLAIITFMFYFFRKIYRSRNDNSLHNVEVYELDQKQTKESLRLMRIAAACLALISFFTTAGGLDEFAFTVSWHAYIASFSIQTVLLVFSFFIWEFYVRLEKREFSSFYKNIIVFIMLLLYLIALFLSSSFSFVFVANNTYKDVKDINSNISIEKFLVSETYNLKNVNESMGEEIKENLKTNVDSIKELIDKEKTGRMSKFIEINSSDEGLKNFSPPSAISKKFNSQSLEGKGNEGEKNELLSSFNTYYEKYEEYLQNYTRSYKKYENIVKNKDDNSLDNLSDYTQMLNGNIENLSRLLDHVNGTQGAYFTDSLTPFKNDLSSNIDNLVNKSKNLKVKFEELESISPQKGTNDDEISLINDILTTIYTDNPDSSKINDLRNDLILNINENIVTDQIGSEDLLKINDFTNYLKYYGEYAELKTQLENYINNEVKRSYIIVDSNNPVYENLENEGGIVNSGEYRIKADNSIEKREESQKSSLPEAEKNIYYTDIQKWKEERKRQFSEFTNSVKLLPQITEMDTSKYNGKENYKEDKVLEKAYTMNRDLLEPISDYEQAFNYFKYDFKMIAWIALFIAVFFDISAFLIGGFMFSAKYFIENDSLDYQQHGSTKLKKTKSKIRL
ncbi:hypothetical protein [Eubacterium limosum]|uniref:hypothetical protein n=1 Tax=Eubacterium limosum TaxID=1736 RepID=UPI0010629A36|nr:hypothetical protein [Eubacterium limosum]